MKLSVFMALIASCDAIKLDSQSHLMNPDEELKKINAAADSAAKSMEGSHSAEELAKTSQSAADQIRNIGKAAISNLDKPEEGDKP